MTASTNESIGWTMKGMTARPTAVGAHRRTTGEFLIARSTRNELSATYASPVRSMSAVVCIAARARLPYHAVDREARDHDARLESQSFTTPPSAQNNTYYTSP